MAANEDPADDQEPEEKEEQGKDAAKPGKGKAIMIIAMVLTLVLGGAAVAYLTGAFNPLLQKLSGPATPAVAVETGPPFFDLPEMVVNLSGSERRATFLKLQIALEVETAEDLKRIEFLLPRVIDYFQVYLRELRTDDLKGAAGLARLREELMLRASAALAPTKVNDVLFKELLVQ
jgi:flagellar FliL protein